MITELKVESLTKDFHEKLRGVMTEYMSALKFGDETPDQAVQWDYHVSKLVDIAEAIYNQNK